MEINKIKPNPDNPRHIKDDKFKKLCESIKKFPKMMELRPMVVDNDGVILGGNMRYKALRELGYTEIPDEWVKRAEDLTEEEKKQFIVKDNMPFGEWNFDELANQFEVDDLLEWGFDEKDLKIEMEVEEDDVPDVPEEAKSKLGEIYQLGNHRLMCGDATKIEDVEKLMDGQKADMVFTDPPYGMDLDTDYTKIMDRGKKYDRVIGDDEEWVFDSANHFNCAEQIWWGADWYRRTLPVGGSWFVWDKQISEHDGLSHTGSLFELAWSKTPHKREIIKAPYFRFYGMDTQERLHPTQKPIKLCSWFIEKFSEKDSNIIDLFGGSGSTLIACEQLNRKCYMMELDPKYIDVIIKRWEQFTGNKAEKISE